jgi:hypothetical protein
MVLDENCKLREKGQRMMNPPSSGVSSATLADTVLGLAALSVRHQIRMVVKTDEGRPNLLCNRRNRPCNFVQPSH